jgi:ribosomal protein S18 acetylase RimI-like enzyme
MTTIRRLRKEDSFDDLIELSRQFFEEYEVYHDEFFEIDQLNDDDIVGYFSRFLDKDDQAAFVAIADEKMIGYITAYVQSQPDFWKVKRVGVISGLMVRKDCRRAGIGGRLFGEATTFFKEKGTKYFTVFTAAGNETALEFYRQNHMAPLYVTMINETGSYLESAKDNENWPA